MQCIKWIAAELRNIDQPCVTVYTQDNERWRCPYFNTVVNSVEQRSASFWYSFLEEIIYFFVLIYSQLRSVYCFWYINL